MARLQFPILRKEMQGVLRRRLTFFFALVFYVVLGSGAVYYFGQVQGIHPNRGDLGRILFSVVVLLGYPCLGLFAAFYSSSVLVVERERGTLDTLLTSPVSGKSVIFQKVLAPTLTAWLLVFGLLPILSLVFILGGVSPREFLHEFVSLAIWIGTCVMIGAAVSVKAKSSSKALGWTVGVLTLLVGLPIVAYLYSMIPFFGPRREGVLLWFLAPVFWISPWGNGFLSTFDGNPSGVLFLPNLYFDPPGAVNWILNTLLQLFLYLRLSFVWDRAMEVKVSVPVAERLKRYPVFRVLLTPLVERKRTDFTTGERSIFEHQGRTLFTRATRRIHDLLTEGFLVVWTLFLLAFLTTMADNLIHLLFIVNTLVIGFFCLGMASTSFARERDRDTATLLWVTPHSANRVFLEKLKYYLSFTWKMLIPAWGFPLLIWMIHTLGFYHERDFWELFRLTWRVAAFVPLATLLAVYGGVLSRGGLAPVILGGIMTAIGTGLTVLFLSYLSWQAIGPRPNLSLLPLAGAVYVFIAPGVMGVAGSLLSVGFLRFEVLSENVKKGMAAMGLGLFCLALLDLLFLTDRNMRWLSNEIRWVLVPLSFATLLFWSMMRKPEGWWLDRMTREET